MVYQKSAGSQEVLAVSKLSQINHYMRRVQEMSTYFRRKLAVLMYWQIVQEIRFILVHTSWFPDYQVLKDQDAKPLTPG